MKKSDPLGGFTITFLLDARRETRSDSESWTVFSLSRARRKHIACCVYNIELRAETNRGVPSLASSTRKSATSCRKRSRPINKGLIEFVRAIHRPRQLSIVDSRTNSLCSFPAPMINKMPLRETCRIAGQRDVRGSHTRERKREREALPWPPLAPNARPLLLDYPRTPPITLGQSEKLSTPVFRAHRAGASTFSVTARSRPTDDASRYRRWKRNAPLSLFLRCIVSHRVVDR